MKITDGSGQNPGRLEKIVLEGLYSFFANPRYFDRVVLTVRRSTAQLATKLEQVTTELVEIDRQSEALEQTAGSVLAKMTRQQIREDLGAALLGSTRERLLQLRRERAALEVHEVYLGRDIAALETFEQEHPWCRFYGCQPAAVGADLREVLFQSVVIQLRA